MPGIVAFPTVVEQALQEFGSVFANEPERVHFGEYLTGLLVASRKNVSGINAEFAVTTDQSCLNRWITEAAWDVRQLNQRRLDWLQQAPSTRYSAHGVIALDNTLINHEGKLIEDVGWLWDHADQRHVIAHDYLIANYVCTSGKHYPLEFRRFRKEDDDPATFKNHTLLFKELVDWVIEAQIPGDFTFDCYFTSAEILNHIQQQQRAYVGDLKFNRKVWFGGREMKASEVAAQIDTESRKLVTIGEQKYWYFTKTLHIPQVDHPVRLVILWERKNGAEPVKMMVTNRVYWEISRLLNVYRKRWTGTETFHRDGKQHLGMGDCQLRKGEGQTRHMYLVMMAHALLVAQMRQGRASEWAHAMLTTVGEACRAIMRETLGNTITWAIDKATKASWSHDRILAHLALT